jgi:hypothetical protein
MFIDVFVIKNPLFVESSGLYSITKCISSAKLSQPEVAVNVGVFTDLRVVSISAVVSLEKSL